MGLFSFFRKDSGEFSHLTKEKFDDLVSNGRLVKIYLIDIRFGGSELSDNVIYVTKAAADIKKQVDDELENYINIGRNVQGYRCHLSYKGKSRVPASINIQASVDNQNFNRNIKVW